MNHFQNLTELNLQILTLMSLKHNLERDIAYDVITLSFPDNIFKRLFYEKNRSKEVIISKNDYIGLEMIFVLNKQSGKIKLALQKKRHASIKISFVHYHYAKSEVYSVDCRTNLLWVKSILFEFDKIYIRYIKQGFSGKLKRIKELIVNILHNIEDKTKLYVYIDIPGNIFII